MAFPITYPQPGLPPASSSPPPRPIAIRPDSELIATAEPETIITVRNRAQPWHPLDYIIARQDGSTLFTVQGRPWSLAQKRVFRDASGLPLFELRSKWFASSVLELKLPGAKGTSEPLLSAKCRVAVQAPRAVIRFCNAAMPRSGTACVQRSGPKGVMKALRAHPRAHSISDEGETVMEIFALDVDNLAQVAVIRDQQVAIIDRITDPSILAQGQKPPFRFRPMWRVRVARGVDLALVAVAVVIVGQRVSVGLPFN
ncbi:hypothetical protein BDV18DRAFT_160314 [Aspergillus unguis]